MSMKVIQGTLLACSALVLISGNASAALQECTGATLGVSTSVAEGVEGGVGNRVAFIEEQVTIECGGSPVTFAARTGGVNPDDPAVTAVQQQQLKNILSMALIAQTQPAVKAVVNTDPTVFQFFVLGASLE